MATSKWYINVNHYLILVKTRIWIQTIYLAVREQGSEAGKGREPLV